MSLRLAIEDVVWRGNTGVLSGCHMPDLMVDGVRQVAKLQPVVYFGILQWKQLGGAGGWVGIGSIESALLLGGLEKVEDVDWVVVLC